MPWVTCELVLSPGANEGELLHLGERLARIDEAGQLESPLKAGVVQLRDSSGREMTASWEALTSLAAGAWPQYVLWDATYLPLDPCFRLRLLTTKHPLPENMVPDFHRITVVLNVSALAPVHAIYTAFERRRDRRNLPSVVVEGSRPETVAEVAWLDDQARRHMGSDRLTGSILGTIAPDLVCGTRRAGEATLADVLFGLEKT